MKGLRAVAPILLFGLVLTACIDNGGGDSANGTDPSAPVIGRADSADAVALNDAASVDQPAADAESAESAAEQVAERPGYAAIPLAGLTNKPLASNDIKGSWVGLFGKEKMGVIEIAWEEGHRIDFLPDGQALWSRLVNGVVVETMDSQWAQYQERLDLQFSADDAVKSGLASIAPLGLATDGSVPPGGSGSSPDDPFNPMESSLMITRYPSYLVLTDKFGKMMVYGLLPESDPAVGAQGLAGFWTASLKQQPDGTVGVGFSDGEMVLDQWAEGDFTGKYVQGYFVGKLRKDGTDSYAVAAYNEHTGGNIHGIICEGPYYTTHAPFEFIR